MNFCEKLYVGFQRDRYTASDDPRVLGFAVPYDNTKASKKRQETVNYWANNKEECRIIDNTPTRGFKLLEVATRYRTNNKLFRVQDPRGFELEISADCLLELAQNSTIVKGEIIEECVWAQHNGVWLMPTSSEEYKLWTKQAVKGEKTKIEAGNYYVNVGNMLSIFRFEGIYQHTYLEYNHVADKGEWETVDAASYYARQQKQLRITEYHTNVSILMNSGKKPTYIYTEFILDSDGNVKRKEIHARKSHFKNLVPHEDELVPEIKEYVLDVMQWVEGERRSYDIEEGDDRGPTESINGNKRYDGFFKTKEEARAFDYSEIIPMLNASERGYYNSVNTDKISRPYGAYSYYHRDYLSPAVVQTFNVKDKR